MTVLRGGHQVRKEEGMGGVGRQGVENVLCDDDQRLAGGLETRIGCGVGEAACGHPSRA